MDKQALKKLQKLWYKKLKKSGFVDIEQDEDRLTFWSSEFSKRVFDVNYGNRIEFIKAKEEYYRLATYFLNDYEFKDETEKQIWELHSSGKSMRDISTAVRVDFKTANKDNINATIRRLSKEMLEKYRNSNE